MLCDICKKKKAVIHYTEFIDGNYKELHLCQDCAAKKDFLDGSFHFIDSSAESGHGIKFKTNSEQSYNSNELKCKNCGLTFEQFRKIGKLGCSQCYKYFYEELKPLLSRIHNSNQHTGKQPINKSYKSTDYETLKQLKKDLQNAVNAEDYEKAILLRDKINKLLDQ
jgi:protein arginine kinase activator